MIKRILLSLLIATATLGAADLTGKWAGTMETLKGGPGAPPVDDHFLVLKQSGDAITGTAGPRESAQWAIQNARLAGNKLTFETTAPGGVFVLSYELEVKEDILTGRMVTKKGPEIEGKLQLRRGKP